jgi:predicted kinase
MLEAGHSVIAEFGSWDRDERDRLRGIGVAAGARTELHWLDAPVDVCIERVRARGGDGADVLANAILRDSAHQYRAPAPDETDHYDRYVAPGEEWQA